MFFFLCQLYRTTAALGFSVELNINVMIKNGYYTLYIITKLITNIFLFFYCPVLLSLWRLINTDKGVH